MNLNRQLRISTLLLLLFFTQVGLGDTNPKEEASAQVTPAKRAAAYEINWQVISSGATNGTSTSYRFQGTLGQPVIGEGSSESFRLSHGFWQEFGPPTCCVGIRGDVDMSGTINVADVTYLSAYLKQKPPGSPAPPCFEEGDVNGSGTINVADVTYLSAYLKQKPPGSPPPPACP
jgi:hypothetical protein